MKRIIITLAIVCGLALAFLGGSYYTLRFQTVTYDENTGFYVLTSCGQSENYYIEQHTSK